MGSDFKTGSCSCGHVSFQVVLPFEKVVICHCDNCQKRTGSAFGLMIYFKADQVRFSPENLSVYHYKAESGNAMQSHFCRTCGASVFLTGDLNTGLIGVAGGCFDDDRFYYDVDREIFCRSKAPFVKMTAMAASSLFASALIKTQPEIRCLKSSEPSITV